MLNLQNASLTAFTVSELLKENQQGVKITPFQISVKVLGLRFSSKLDRVSYIISMANLPPGELEPRFVLWSFFLAEVVLYLYKSTIWPCLEYCCHVLVGVPCCYLNMLDKLQKPIGRIVGPLLAVSIESLAHFQNVASLNLFHMY